MLCLMTFSDKMGWSFLQEALLPPVSLSQTFRHTPVCTEQHSQAQMIILSCSGLGSPYQR